MDNIELLNVNYDQKLLDLDNENVDVKKTNVFTEVNQSFERSSSEYTEVEDFLEIDENNGKKENDNDEIIELNKDSDKIIEINTDSKKNIEINTDSNNRIIDIAEGEEEEIDNQSNPGADQDGIVFDELSTAGKMFYMLRRFPMDEPEYKEIREISKEITKLNITLSNPDADPELRKELAAASMDLHVKTASFLKRIKTEEPERFNTNTNIANLAAVYNINSNFAVDQIEEENGNVLPAFMDRAFNDLVKAVQGDRNEERQKQMSDGLAKVLYLAKLKNEFDNVHGTPEEQKEWRAAILNEILSDQFEDHVKNFKESNVYKKAWDKFENFFDPDVTDIEVKGMIDTAITDLADDLYHDVYRYKILGFKNQEEKEKLVKACDEIDELRAMGNAIGVKQAEAEENKDFNNHPSFDTVFLKKICNLYGPQENLAGELRREDEKKDRLKNAIATAQEEEVSNLLKEQRIERERYNIKSGIYADLNKYENINDTISVIKANIAALDEAEEKEKQSKANAEKPGAKEENKENEREKLRKLYQSQLDKKLEEKEESYKKLSDNYDPVELNSAMEKYGAFREKERNIESLKEKARQDAKERVTTFLNGINVEPVNRNIELLVVGYDNAVKNNKKNEIQDYRNHRRDQDNIFKQRNTEIYSPVTYKGENVYISRPKQEALDNMDSSFAEHKRKNNIINDPKLDKKYEDSISKYKDAEDKYREKTPFVKPDRGIQNIAEFKPETEFKIGDLNLDRFKFTKDVRGIIPEYIVEVENNAPENEMSPFSEANAKDFADGFESLADAMKNRTAFLGTDEYDKIVHGLEELKTDLSNGVADDAQNLTKARLLLARMNLYIDRKNDEKEHSWWESSTAKKRRLVAQQARVFVNRFIEVTEKRTNEFGKDHSFETSAAELEAMLDLTGKKEDPTLSGMLTSLKQKNYSEALNGMNRYLFTNRNKYFLGDGYRFRLRENEEGGKLRLFPSDNGKIYKSVLLNFERLENSYLKHIAENDQKKLPGALFSANHAMNKVSEKKSIAQALGIRINTEDYEINPKIRHSDSLANHKKQFEDHYRIYLNEAFYANASRRGRSGKSYIPTSAFCNNDQKAMTDSALSVYFLNSLDPDKPFDEKKVEEDRKKFISAMRGSSVYLKIGNACADYFDFRKCKVDDVLETGKIRWQEISNTDKFKEKIIVNEMAKAIAGNINESMDLLTENGRLQKTAINNRMDDSTYILKLAKLLGITEKVKTKAQDMIQENEMKGDNLEGTIKKVNDVFSAKTVKKQEAPTKGVNPLKL